MEFNPITYFEQIARESVYLMHTDKDKHFGIASGIIEAEDLCNNVLSITNHQLIVIDNPNGMFMNNEDVNLVDVPVYSYIILKHLDNTSDMKERATALRECKNIGRKIFTRMRKDSHSAMKLPSKQDAIGLRHIDQSSMRYYAVGLLGESFIGIEFSFSIANAENDVYDEDEWITNNS